MSSHPNFVKKWNQTDYDEELLIYNFTQCYAFKSITKESNLSRYKLEVSSRRWATNSNIFIYILLTKVN